MPKIEIGSMFDDTEFFAVPKQIIPSKKVHGQPIEKVEAKEQPSKQSFAQTPKPSEQSADNTPKGTIKIKEQAKPVFDLKSIEEVIPIVHISRQLGQIQEEAFENHPDRTRASKVSFGNSWDGSISKTTIIPSSEWLYETPADSIGKILVKSNEN